MQLVQMSVDFANSNVRRVAAEQYQSPLVGKQLPAIVHQRDQIAVNFPPVTLDSMSVAWRVEQDRFILFLSSQFTLYECNRIVHDPTDGRFG